MRALAALALASAIGGCAPDAVRPEALAPVPELARAVDGDPSDDVVEIELAAGPADHEIVPGRIAHGLAYHDLAATTPATMPGPLVEVSVGQTLVVWLRNDLPGVSTTLHFHGMRTPADVDGNPMTVLPIAPGRTQLHRFVVRDPGLYWFHPHTFSDEHVELGLQGLVLVRRPDEPRAPRERVLVLDDVDLDAEGDFDLAPDHEDHLLGRHGDTLLVNGRPPGAMRAVAGSVERWRLANTANGRHFELARSDGQPFEVIAWDGPPLARAVEVWSLALAPGERRDVLVRIPDAAFDLVTRAVPQGGGLGTWEAATLAHIDVERGDPGVAIDARLLAAVVDPIEVSETVPVRRLVLEADVAEHDAEVMTINGSVWPFGVPLESSLGEIQVWEVANVGDLAHPFHVHGTFFQVLTRDGLPEPIVGWRDTVALGPHETIRIGLRYDAPGRWMFHCAIPEHAHMGMMGDVVVADVAAP